ncbi:MAG TPA: tetratricopeptide repeat protein, partial [Chthoniobacterales bacterium]
MKFRKFATIALLVLSSFAADTVAPSKTELESMYDKAFREFDAGNYEQSLKDLDAIDARQPDLAESQNLRGVILMRQKDYPNAEKALQKALAADPKFWNARFNLAEIPFLEKNWPEARKRFGELLNGNASELQGEARQLIQYKILITHVMEGNNAQVESMLAKFEISPDTPAVHYANAAIALNKKDEKAAKDALTTAEKAFSPQLNKLFAESLYEVGWLDKPAGQTRAALELNSAAEKAAKTKAFAKAKYDEAEQALAQRDFTAARKLIDEADQADPNQAAIVNLRGEILLEQKDFAAAESEFRKASKLDPKFRDAQYNLAQVPFKQKDYAKARERFESLFSSTTGADKDRAAQLIKYKVYLTYLLDGKDARAQKMMEQFQFTGDTPALYYAQAAWEFKHNNGPKANDWVTSARKIYPPALNGVFADAFFDLGWLQSSEAAASPAPLVADANPAAVEPAPSIEPTPLPNISLAKNEKEKAGESLSLAVQPNAAVPGMEAMTSTAAETPAASSAVGATASPSVETPVASTASPAAARPVIASPSEADQADDAGKTRISPPAANASPATVLAPAQVRAWAEPSLSDKLSSMPGNAVILTILLVAGILLLAWAVIPGFRRRAKASPERNLAPAAGPSLDETDAPAADQYVTPTRLAGGPPQVSLQLRASEPALRRATMPSGKNGRPFGNGNGNGHGNGHANGNGNGFGNGHTHGHAEQPVAAPAPAAAAAFAPAAETFAPAPAAFTPPPSFETDFTEGVGEPQPIVARESVDFGESVGEVQSYQQPAVSYQEPAVSYQEPVVSYQPEPAPVVIPAAPIYDEPAVIPAPEAVQDIVAPEPVTPEVPNTFEVTPTETPTESAASFAPAEEAVFEAAVIEEPAAEEVAPEPQPIEVAATAIESTEEAVAEEAEPIDQGQPVPYLAPVTAEAEPAATVATPEPEPVAPEPAPVASTPAPATPSRGLFATVGSALAGIGALRHSPARTSPAAAGDINAVTAQQPTTPTMPTPIQPTPAPVIRTGPTSPMTSPAAPQQMGVPQQTVAPQTGGGGGGGMHTAVQLTFSTEIASLQLTPSFKMGALQLRPISRIVTMRLSPSQNPQPAMNLQVTFEISSVQLAGNAIGTVRLTPSQQQRPGVISSPSF